MKILHLLASPYWSGPMENVALLAAEQKRLGHEASVAIDLRRKKVVAEELARTRLQEAGLLDGSGLELSVKSPPWRWLSDFSRLRSLQVDVVHSHFTHDHLLAAWALPRSRTLVRSIHAPRSLRRFLPRAHALTFPHGVHPRSKSLAAPHMFLPPLLASEYRPSENRAALRAALGLDGAPLVGMVSTFKASRRHLLALTAFAKLLEQRPRARLVLIGDGELGPLLRARAGEMGLRAQVSFLGYLQKEAFVRALQALDEVWVLGSGNDFSGRAALQARACGVRVLGVDEGGLALFSDEVVQPTVDSLVHGSLMETRRVIDLPSNEAIALEVIHLYRRAAERG